MNYDFNEVYNFFFAATMNSTGATNKQVTTYKKNINIYHSIFVYIYI